MKLEVKSGVRVLVRWVYWLRYGVRGALKPPINRGGRNSIWYRWRYRMWCIDEAVYRWTGLPDRWWRVMRGDGKTADLVAEMASRYVRVTRQGSVVVTFENREYVMFADEAWALGKALTAAAWDSTQDDVGEEGKSVWREVKNG